MTIPDKLIATCSWDEMRIYILIKKSKSPLSVRQLAKELKLPQTNVYRLLKRLQGFGFIGTPSGTPSGTPNILNSNIVTSGRGTPSGTPSGTLKNNIEKRKSDFEHSLVPYVTSGQYKPEMVRAFSDYWTEFNKSRTKMRWELQKTWETSKRLATWANRVNVDSHNNTDDTLKNFV